MTTQRDRDYFVPFGGGTVSPDDPSPATHAGQVLLKSIVQGRRMFECRDYQTCARLDWPHMHQEKGPSLAEMIVAVEREAQAP